MKPGLELTVAQNATIHVLAQRMTLKASTTITAG